MKTHTILTAMATMALLPTVAAQEPAPALTPLPQGVMVSTRAFINGRELPPEEAAKLIRTVQVRTTCSNPDCTCGPAPKPCECKPGATCGPKTATTPPPAPVPPAGRTDAPAPTVVATPTAGGVAISIPATKIRPAIKKPTPATCPNCHKPRRATPQPGDMPPCGKARPFGTPMHGTTPPCAHRHGKIVRPARIDIRKVEPKPTAPAPAPAAESPKAVKVIINGVEAIVPVVPEGVNITIKPL
ncbi:MAG: hypothetical protein II295_08540 [Akkermansia sp.]|nr:hypothetical protein [Akkermansia sp.]